MSETVRTLLLTMAMALAGVGICLHAWAQMAASARWQWSAPTGGRDPNFYEVRGLAGEPYVVHGSVQVVAVSGIAWCDVPVVCSEGRDDRCSLPGTAPCDVDLNGDGVVGMADRARFGWAWATQDPEADWDASGGVGLSDYAVLSRYYGMRAP